MKKLFFLFMALIILSGCNQGKIEKITEKNAPENVAGYNESGVVGRINDIKNGLTPKIKSSGTPSADDSAEAGTEAQGKQVQLENLTAQYDSAIIKTNLGEIKVGFYLEESPLTVNNFLNLAKAGFYNGTKFHRVIKDFMIQGGDPNSKDDDWSNDGQGGPGYQFQDEINAHKLVKGSLAMANSGANTNGSQFFIVTAESTPWLDGKHTNFGYVIGGLDVVEKIEKVKVNENSHPTEDVIINSIELTKSNAGDQQKIVGPELPPDASSTPAIKSASSTPVASREK